jgi:hypothetical protein
MTICATEYERISLGIGRSWLRPVLTEAWRSASHDTRDDESDNRFQVWYRG